MQILVVAATEEEAAPLRTKLNDDSAGGNIHFLITGVGIAATTYRMTNFLAKSATKFNLALNIGCAGSFSAAIQVGDVVMAGTDEFADLGAEDGSHFISLFEMGLLPKNNFPFTEGRLLSMDYNGEWKKVKAITVNTVHGNEESIQRVIAKCSPDIESMEGAAFHYVCAMENIPALQLRAISNRVERRNKAAWKIPLAITNLTDAAFKLLQNISHKP